MTVEKGLSVQNMTLIPFVDLKTQYQSIQSDVLSAVQNVFTTAAFIMGPDVQRFEMEFAEFIGAKHCVGVESGTAALKLGLEALGVGSGDEVIIPANTYIACAFAISQVGATPVLVDMADDYLIDVAAIESAITSKCRAIMPVHLYGQSAQIDAIVEIARRHNLYVVEDASQAHGSRYNGQRTGTFGDVGCFSFYPGKNLGAYGDGGGIVTNDDGIADQLRLLRDFGQKKKYEHLIIGDNCRLDTVQAAILRVKLKHLDAWNAQRSAAARMYDERLSAIGLQPPARVTDERHVYHLYVVQVPRRELAMAALANARIQSGIHYPIPIHMQPAYCGLNMSLGSFPKTEAAAARILSLPMFPEITEEQIDRVSAVLKAHVACGDERYIDRSL